MTVVKKINVKRQQTSINLEIGLWKKVKIEAINRDMEAQELVELALKKELNLKN